MNSEDLKIAVVGSGYWGKNLIRNYQRLKVLNLICDKSEPLLSSHQEQLPIQLQDFYSHRKVRNAL